MKNQMRRVFQNDVAGQFGLQRGAMRFQFLHHARCRCRAEDADENMRVLQIGRDVDLVDAHERAFESYFARDDRAQLPFHEFVDAE